MCLKKGKKSRWHKTEMALRTGTTHKAMGGVGAQFGIGTDTAHFIYLSFFSFFIRSPRPKAKEQSRLRHGAFAPRSQA